MANGALAVGACHMDGLPREINTLQQGSYAFQSRLDSSHEDMGDGRQEQG